MFRHAQHAGCALATANPARDGVRDRVLLGLAWTAFALSIPTLAGWFLRVPSLLQPLSVFPPARPGSVLVLWAASGGFLALVYGSRVLSRVGALATITIATIGIVLGVFGVWLPRERAILSRIPTLSSTVITDGVGVATAAMFMAFGVALWMLQRAHARARELTMAGAVGSGILAGAVLLVVAQVSGLLEGQASMRLVQSSLQSIVGTFCLGVAMLRYVARREAIGVAPPRWLPVLSGVASSLLVVLLWQTLVRREEAETQARATIASDAIQRAVRRQLIVVERAISRVAVYVQSAPPEVPLWHTNIDRLALETDGLDRIEWLDSTGTPIRSTGRTPLSDTTAAQLRALTRQLVRDASMDSSRDTSTVALGASYQLVHAPWGAVVMQRVQTKTHGLSVMAGLLSEASLLREFISDSSSGFAIRALVRDSMLLPGIAHVGTSVYESSMMIGARRIDFQFMPYPMPIRSTLPELVLVLGLAVAGLVTTTLWLARKSWERASIEGMSRMQRAIERATDGVWELEVQTGYTHRSEALLRYLGYEPSMLNGLIGAWSALIHPEDRDRYAAALDEHLRGRRDAFECEYRVRAANGGWHTVADRGRVIEFTVDRRPSRVLGIAADITERVRANAAREESEHRFRVMFDSTFQMQMLLDAGGMVLEANSAAADFASLEPSQLHGQAFSAMPWWNAVDNTRQRVQERFEQARAGDATRFEVQITASPGVVATVEFSLKPVRDINEYVVQVLVEGRDLTERKRVEESLRQIGALATMGQLAARVAHEINNPLAGIQNAFLLVRGSIPTDHPHYRFVGAIEREIARIAAVTRQLYETYRPDQSMDSRSSVILSMSDAVTFLEQVNRARNIRIVTDVTRAPSMVPVPDALLRQALYNLVQNAIDASPTGGTVEVSATQDDDQCIIRVSDQGQGIPHEIRARIFDPFFSTKDRTVKTGGMGIGLSLVRQSVLAVGGRVDVLERAGGGTIFEVRLPLTPIDTGVLQ